MCSGLGEEQRTNIRKKKKETKKKKLDGSLPPNPVNDRHKANAVTLKIDRQPRRFIYPKDGGRFDAPKMHVFTHLLRKCFTGKSKVRLRPPKSTIYGGSKWPLFTPKTAWIKIA